MSGKLDRYLADIGQRAQGMMGTIIQQMTEAQGITETLKSNNQMAWIRQKNNIRNTVEEIIQAEIIYA